MTGRLLASLAILPSLAAFAKGPEVELDLAGGTELRETLATVDPTIVAKPPPPPKTVAFWDFDKEKPDLKGLPRGWTAGIWGDRRVDYGTEEGCGGKGRSMKIGVRYIVGGELQVFQYAWWAMQKGDYYRVSFKARGFDHPSGFNIQIREIAGQWRTVLGKLDVKLTNEWKEYSFGGFLRSDWKPGEIGIMIGVNEAGYFALDDIRVETFGPYPPPPSPDAAKPPAPVPVTLGNLIPRGSYESPEDAFWLLDHLGADPDETLFEPGFSRAEGGLDGRHCLRFSGRRKPDGKLSGGASVRSIDIPVATGQVYTLSVWARSSEPWPHLRIGGESGEFRFASPTASLRSDEWTNVRCRTKPIPAWVRTVRLRLEFESGAEVFVDRMYFGCDQVHPQKLPASAPCELALGFIRKEPDDPRIVWWGEKLPLTVGAWKSSDKVANAPESVPATIRVTAWPNRVTHEEKVVLKVGEERRIEVDPGANGVLRVELLADDPDVAKRNELVMGRLPKPRATGAEGRFGIHARISPQVLALARAMGLTWQRIHDCSPITNMGWGNPKPGEYRWADPQVDALRKYGFCILGMPDYPPEWLIEEKTVVDSNWEKRHEKEKKGEDLSFEIPKDTLEDVDETIAAEVEKRNEETERKAHSWTVKVYDKEAFRTWCREAAKHYRGRIDHWEIWNEPYMEYFFKGDIMEFGRVFNAGAKGVREGNPDAKVVGWCNEFTSPHYSNPFRKQYPVEEKPDVNSMHLYFLGLQGTGECGIEKVVAEYPKTLGEYRGSELWDTEGGWPSGGSLYSWRGERPESLERAAAHGARCWTETFFGGIDRLFFFMMFNENGAMDADRSLNAWGAVTATTAWFIDAMKPVRSIESPKGAKLRVFTGCGRSSAAIFDDCLERGRPKLDPAKLPAGWLVTDAMGNDLRPGGAVELGFAPCFVLAEGVTPERIGEVVSDAVEKGRR